MIGQTVDLSSTDLIRIHLPGRTVEVPARFVVAMVDLLGHCQEEEVGLELTPIFADDGDDCDGCIGWDACLDDGTSLDGPLADSPIAAVEALARELEQSDPERN